MAVARALGARAAPVASLLHFGWYGRLQCAIQGTPCCSRTANGGYTRRLSSRARGRGAWEEPDDASRFATQWPRLRSWPWCSPAPATAAPTTKTYPRRPDRGRPVPGQAERLRHLTSRSRRRTRTSAAMEVDIVDANGRQVPISRLMLHHIVFANMGAEFGEQARRHVRQLHPAGLAARRSRPGASASTPPARSGPRCSCPRGYGYPSRRAQDQWAMTWMMMNHRNKTDTRLHPVHGHLRHRAPEAGHALLARRQELPVRPDLRRARAAARRARPPQVRPTGRLPSRAGSSPAAATCTAAPRISRSTGAGASCTPPSPPGARPSTRSTTCKPVLHEPGPINMSGFTSAKGFARAPRRDAAAGLRLRRPSCCTPA